MKSRSTPEQHLRPLFQIEVIVFSQGLAIYTPNIRQLKHAKLNNNATQIKANILMNSVGAS